MEILEDGQYEIKALKDELILDVKENKVSFIRKDYKKSLCSKNTQEE